MIAGCFQNSDGNFDFIRFAISLVGLALALGTLFVVLPGAIKTGKIEYFGGSGFSRICNYEREKSPFNFWLVFVLYSLMIPMGIYIFYKGSVGP